jgi:hypothetical protein
MIPIILVMTLTCCSTEDSIEFGTKYVSIKISTNKPATYGEVSPQDYTMAAFNSGDIYFTNEAGVIIKHYTIKEEANSETNIRMSDITGLGGILLDSIPDVITKIFVIGNTPDLATEGNIADIIDKALDLSTQIDINDINLYGDGTLTLKAGGKFNEYTCNIQLMPSIARVNITDIMCDGDITGFSVEGIFIDYYYNAASVNGNISSENFINNNAIPDIFSYDTEEYPLSTKGITHDIYNPKLISVDRTVKLADSKLWGYFSNGI